MRFSIIAAIDSQGGLSCEGKLPWANSTNTDVVKAALIDMKFFKAMTKTENDSQWGRKPVVIMGRKTFETLPGKKPLTGRLNIVLTRSAELSQNGENLQFARSFNDALNYCKDNNLGPVWVIGGAQIYKIAIYHPLAQHVYINFIPDDNTLPQRGYKCDLFFPLEDLQGMFNIVQPITCNTYPLPKGLVQYKQKDYGEQQYLQLLNKLNQYPQTPNRTGIPTHSSFAEQLRFNLYHSKRGAIMPLLTTKKMSYKLIITELLWFLNGWCINVDYLHKFGNRIWEPNTTREFLDSRGMTEKKGYREGDTGQIYGFQWRHWGGEIKDAQAIGGIDQLSAVISELKTNPHSRRLIVSAWNVEKLGDMALPPCHWNFQFHVEYVELAHNVNDPLPKFQLNPYGEIDADGIPVQDNKPYIYRLNCCVNMRSADMALGVPFNIASYATLVHIISKITGMIPGTLAINMTDCHLYHNHIEGIKVQIERNPIAFPLFRFGSNLSKKDDLCLDDFNNQSEEFLNEFKILNYYSHPVIKYPMAV